MVLNCYIDMIVKLLLFKRQVYNSGRGTPTQSLNSASVRNLWLRKPDRFTCIWPVLQEKLMYLWCAVWQWCNLTKV